jgi:hypothetical protein
VRKGRSDLTRTPKFTSSANVSLADSDEVAQAIRDDVAHGYEMISPPGPEPRWRVDLFGKLSGRQAFPVDNFDEMQWSVASAVIIGSVSS